MTMRTAPMIGVDIHFGPDSIRHKYHPGDDKCHAYGVLKIDNGSSTYANLYFDTDPAHIDKMIAELVALKQEMDPPVVPPCGKCHYPLDSPGHDEMCEQRAAFLAAPSGMQDPAPVARVITDSERTCPEQHPGSGAPCHRDGDHGVHRDTDGETWRTDGLVGRIVAAVHDDSPCPLTGKIVGQVDEETVEVLWGDRQFEENPGQGTYEPFDALRPVTA